LRVKAGKSQKAIAEKIGLDPTKLSKIEAGVIDPPFSLGCKIIAAIEMEPAEALELLRMYQEDTE
jgi:transcriptional regulator with XRE-family HTH domain